MSNRLRSHVMQQGPILEVEDVSFSADDITILDRVSWTVCAGEHWSVLGPNGSGKTTLLRIATGLIWPNAGGFVRRCGQQFLDLRELRRSIGWVSSTMTAAIPAKEPVLDTVVTGRFAQLGLRKLAWDPPSETDYLQAAEYLSQMGCSAIEDRPFGVLSQGEKQKVLIARARMARPLLIILDEPCAGLDPGARERFLASLSELLEDPASPSLVLVTHHIEEIVPAITNTLVLHAGRVARCGRTTDIVDRELLSEIFDAPTARIESVGGRLWPIWQ